MVAATLPLIRADALDYTPRTQDVLGCRVNPVPFGCLRCPLAVCVYDQPPQVQLRREAIEARERRREQIMALRRQGYWAREIAERLGIGMRTVTRDLAELRRRHR